MLLRFWVQPTLPFETEEAFWASVATAEPEASAGRLTHFVPPEPKLHVFAFTGGGHVPNAQQSVAKLRSGFRRCLSAALAYDPTTSGRVTFDIKVEANGTVRSARSSKNEGLAPAAVECMAHVVETATFDAPGSAGDTLGFSVVFIQQAK